MLLSSCSKILALVILSCIHLCEFTPLELEKFATNYLIKYYYLHESEIGNKVSLKNAIIKFQNLAHLRATGELNKKTIEQMKQSRCGNSDEIENMQNTPYVQQNYKLSTTEDVNLCSDHKIDTIFSNGKGETFVFRGNNYYNLTKNGITPGFHKIASTWYGLPGNIDAAFTSKDGKTYFFKESEFWRFVGTKMDGVFPKKINKYFRGIPDNIDASFIWSGDQRVYFSKGNKFWRFDPLSIKHPKEISVNGVNPLCNIDGGFKDFDGKTYLFQNGSRYRLNDKMLYVDRVDSAYRRFGCKSALTRVFPQKRI